MAWQALVPFITFLCSVQLQDFAIKRVKRFMGNSNKGQNRNKITAARKQQSVNRHRQRRTAKGPDDSIHHPSGEQEARGQCREDVVEKGDDITGDQPDVHQIESEDTRPGLWIWSTPNTHVEPLTKVDI